MSRPTLISHTSHSLSPHTIGSVINASTLLNNKGVVQNHYRKLESYALVFVYSGHGFYRDENGFECKIEPGTLLYLFPGFGHLYRSEPSWDEIFVLFDGPQFKLLEAHGILNRSNPYQMLKPIEYWRKKFQESVEEKANSESPLSRVNRLLDFIVEVNDAATEGERLSVEQAWLQSARMEIESNTPGTVNYRSIAKKMGMSYESFRKKFTRCSGESPGKFRDSLLFSRAELLLRKTNLPIGEISDQLGFCDAFHFSKQFKQAYGQSPRDFRKQNA